MALLLTSVKISRAAASRGDDVNPTNTRPNLQKPTSLAGLDHCSHTHRILSFQTSRRVLSVAPQLFESQSLENPGQYDERLSDQWPEGLFLYPKRNFQDA